MALHLTDVHLTLPVPGDGKSFAMVMGHYEYWHYCCDGVDDRGWGCGYRTLQTLCSWVRQQQLFSHSSDPFCNKKDIEHTKMMFVTQCLRSNNTKKSDAIEVLSSGDVTDADHINECFGSAIEVIARGDVTELDDTTKSSSDVIEIMKSSDVTENCNISESRGEIEVIASGDATGIGVNDQTAKNNMNNVPFQTKEAAASINSGAFNNQVSQDQGMQSRASNDDTNSAFCSPSDHIQSLGTATVLTSPGFKEKTVLEVPSIRKIQQALVTMGDKTSSFLGSRQWIGSYEVCLCLDFFYKVPCKILHVGEGRELRKYLPQLYSHFTTLGSPLMMGGDSDASSKGIFGVSLDPPALLVVDPHFSGKAESALQLQRAGWVKWVPLEDFHQTSFYNLCLPQLTANIS